MAWGIPRRAEGPLPPKYGRSALVVDEIDLLKSFNAKALTTRGSKESMSSPLSPVVEEHSETCDAPLQVHLTVKFYDAAVKSVYNRYYSSSRSFVASDRICRGLLRRIEHCTQELITRKDSNALDNQQCVHKGSKTPRFELTFRLLRHGEPEKCAERKFVSYQKQSLTRKSANEVLRSAHGIIGVFMKRHDDAFEWVDEPSHHFGSLQPESTRSSFIGSLGLDCIPRTHFVESSQTWESAPGYSLELTFKSINPVRRQREIRRVLRLDSAQASPLNLGLGEDLLWQSYRSVEDVLDQRKNAFDNEHMDCEGFDGLTDCGCQHFDDDALNLELRVVNNLAPVHTHLHRSIQSKLPLFNHPTGNDCDELVSKLQLRFSEFRNRIDKKIGNFNDFDLRIAELRGHGWHVKNCCRFVIDGRQFYTRFTIEALLDRVRSGVGDVLREHDVAIRLVAYKRGHLVLDKALVSRDHQPTPDAGILESPVHQQQKLVAQLKSRIQRDIDMVCKDTCTLDDVPEVSRELEKSMYKAQQFPEAAYHTPPGSPARFDTRPPTPPEVPPRKSSVRVFPLVPSKFKVKDGNSNNLPGRLHDSAIFVDYESICRAHGGASPPQSTNPPRISSAVEEKHHEAHDQSKRPPSGCLSPPAEVFPSIMATDNESDSTSTHSSLPPLTECGTSSPGQSVLVTPTGVRSSSPTPHGASLKRHSGHGLSNSPSRAAPGSNQKTYSRVERFVEPNSAGLGQDLIFSELPMTPVRTNTEDSVATYKPQVSEQAKDQSHTEHVPALSNSSSVSNSDSDSDSQRAIRHEECENQSGCVLPPSVEDDHLKAPGLLISPMHEPETNDAVSPIDTEAEKVEEHVNVPAPADAEILPQTDEAPCQTLSAENETCQQAQLKGANGQASTVEYELSRSKIDYFKEDEEGVSSSAVGYLTLTGESMCTESTNLLEPSNGEEHILRLSDSGIDIRDRTEETDADRSDDQEAENPLSLGGENASVAYMQPLQDGTQAEEKATTVKTPSESVEKLALDRPRCQYPPSLVLVEQKSIAAIKNERSSIDTATPTSSRKSSHSLLTAQASSTCLGLGNSNLLPSLPILSSLAKMNDKRTSRASSTEMDDCVSDTRTSFDSVSTVRPSPGQSEEGLRGSPAQDGIPKRLGTPTAGLLGLHESLWAGFGVRGALGNGFERPSTAPMFAGSMKSSDEMVLKDDQVMDDTLRTGPSLSDKPAYLGHKKSIGSFVFKHVTSSPNLKRRGKEARMQSRVPRPSGIEDSETAVETRGTDDGATRFSRAMVIAAGLAFASSVINKHHD